jgi:hypothetical protein
MEMPLADDLGLEELEMDLDPLGSAAAQILDRLQYLRVEQDEAPKHPDAFGKPVRFWVSRLVTDEDRKYARIVDGLCVAAVIFAVICGVLYLSMNTISANAEKTRLVVFLFLFIPCIPVMFKTGSLASMRHKIPPKKWLMIDLITTSVFTLAAVAYAVFS